MYALLPTVINVYPGVGPQATQQGPQPRGP